MPHCPDICNCVKEHVCQADAIWDKGHIVKSPCESCFLKNIPCVMDLKNHNYAACTHCGWKCEKCFYSDREWNVLKCDFKHKCS